MTLVKDIADLIPQKPPFVMVDMLDEYSDSSIVASFTPQEGAVFAEEGFFNAAGVIEHMAQTVALHTGYSYFLKGEVAPMGYIGAIKGFRIEILPQLGETLTTHAHILQEFMGVTLVQIKVLNPKGQEIASAEMKTVIAP